MNTKNNNSVHLLDTLLDTLFVGKRYKFHFTHRKACIGVVCDVDKSKQTFVVYDVATAGYELIPVQRLMSCEGINR